MFAEPRPRRKPAFPRSQISRSACSLRRAQQARRDARMVSIARRVTPVAW
jgi:hypothetical protein